MSIVNVDKPIIAEAEIISRAEQMKLFEMMVITTAKTFLAKSRLFPGRVFIVGHDTAVRIIDPKYYQNDEKEMIRALQEMSNLEIKFAVGGRTTNGIFKSLENIEIPNKFENLFIEIPINPKIKERSSTKIREKISKEEEVKILESADSNESMRFSRRYDF